MELFERHRQHLIESEAPLAARMRPRLLEEFIGQEHILGEGKLLRRAIQADRLSSLIFYGPPGTGKTTLARIVANTTHAHFIAINAVLSGVKEIREAIDTAHEKRGFYSQRTILFIDEVHRFNKAQQDALLPWVENGTILLIGATTENPFFEVNKALVSRSRLFQLRPLSAADLHRVATQALQDRERGYGDLTVICDPEAIAHLVNVANGDARALLNAIELAVETTLPEADGSIRITLAVAEDSIQQRAVLYDKEGDAHFDTISAFIKSVRGSDPDAALYWLARMVYAGEDPRFILRRLLILAGEDVGLADPQAIAIVSACAAAFDRVGMPEGRYHLAHATLYLATAPKSNTVMGFFDALAAVERERQSDVPNHLKDANRDKEGFGHGAGYLYPHAYRDHWVEQQYLPSSLQGKVFYQPSQSGAEAAIRDRVTRQREAQLAAMLEGMGTGVPEMLSYSPPNSAQERWLQRAISRSGEHLGQIRDRLFELAAVERHHVVLDLNAGNGLLVWDAVRRCPEGGVYGRAEHAAEAAALLEQTQSLSDLNRPVIFAANLLELSRFLPEKLRCDRIVGRHVLLREPKKAAAFQQLAHLLHPDGRMVLYETIPRHTQRLYALVERSRLQPQLFQRWVEAEEAIYAQADDPMTDWDVPDLEAHATRSGLAIEFQVETTTVPMMVTAALLERWFAPASTKPSYASYLQRYLSAAEVKTVRQVLLNQLLNQEIPWQSRSVFAIANNKPN